MNDTLADAFIKRCIFCEIAHHDLRGQVEQRWDNSVLFTPLNPCVPGHKLVVPLRHVKDAAEDPDVTAEAYRDAASYLKQLDVQANLITSIGADATQSVWHLHVHVIPRFRGDNVALPWTYQRR